MNKNIKKYSGLSMIMGTVLVLSGCGQVKTVEQEDNLSNRVGVSVDVVNNTNSTSNSTTVLTTSTVTTTTEPYAGYGYKEYMDSQNESSEEAEPFAYAGYGYQEYTESQNESSEEVEPFAYAGYGYQEYTESESKLDNNVAISNCTCDKDMYGQYAYLRYDDSYTITNDDSLQELCNKFGVTVNEFYEINKNIKSFVPGTVVKHPVMDELYIAKKGEKIDYIAVETGVDVETIINNNNLSTDILESDTYLLLHKFNRGENSYVTNKGVVNIINNNRIYGNKILRASGFSGASQKILALNESVYSYGVNDVTLYTFNEDDSYTSDTICFNAKDIISVEGMPVALLRNNDDIEELAASVGEESGIMAYTQWGSTVPDVSTISTSGNTRYVVMNGLKLDDLNVDKGFVKTK